MIFGIAKLKSANNQKIIEPIDGINGAAKSEHGAFFLPRNKKWGKPEG